MNVALTWLKKEDVPLSELAGRLGYQSEAAFSRASPVGWVEPRRG